MLNICRKKDCLPPSLPPYQQLVGKGQWHWCLERGINSSCQQQTHPGMAEGVSHESHSTGVPREGREGGREGGGEDMSLVPSSRPTHE